MKKLFTVAALLLLLSVPLSSADDSVSGLTAGVFFDAELGFRYTLPKGLIDETSYSRDELRKRAAALGTSNNTLEILLRMTSGPPDTAPEWRAISIQTYSHSKFAGLDDRAVEAKMNGWMAGDGVTAIGDPKRVSVAGESFVVTNFEKSGPSHVKYARIYSTIRNGKLLGFAFTANSVDRLQPLADSLETLEFTGDGPVAYFGFDRNEYPGDQSLEDLRATFSYAGYWLNNPPGATLNTWSGTRSKLEAAGFGFMVLFNGRAYREVGSVDRASELGKIDAQRAVAAAEREGFPARTIIFLDQEQGGRLLPEQKAYLFAWVDGVSHAGFRAGVYCSGIAAKEERGESVITAEDIRQNAGGRDIVYWVTNDVCPPSPGCLVSRRPPSPSASGIPFADVWQFAQSPRRKEFAGGCGRTYSADGNCYAPGSGSARQLPVDLNTATSADPSHGR
ncbi:MAG: glycoside hydrolase domain-containing protein [Terriglobales bacterium]